MPLFAILYAAECITSRQLYTVNKLQQRRKMNELVEQAEASKLPQLFIDFLKAPSSHLNLNGAYKDLFRTKITDEILQQIASILLSLAPHNLVLDLGCNELTDLCAASVIKLLPLLSGLSLRTNRLTEQFCLQIKDALRNSRLNYLSLASNELGAAGTAAVCEAIFTGPSLHYGVLGNDTYPYGTLQYLDLQKTQFGEHAAIHLYQYLKSRFCGLRELQLSDVSEQGQYRLINAISYNTSVEALTLRSSELNADLISAFVAEVAVEYEILPETDLISKRVNDMQRVYQRQTQRMDLPRPLQKTQNSQLRVSITPVRFLDLSSCLVSFDLCERIRQHLQRRESFLATIVLDGCRLYNAGANILAAGLLKYQFRVPTNDFYVAAGNLNSVIRDEYELFGFIDTDDGYYQHFKNVYFLQLGGPRVQLINISLRRCQIEGQGVCAIALLTKFNEEIAYVALEQNSFESQRGEGVNADTQWYPRIEWESTFSVRAQTKYAVRCDFGLKRTADLISIYWFKETGRILKAIAVFE